MLELHLSFWVYLPDCISVFVLLNLLLFGLRRVGYCFAFDCFSSLLFIFKEHWLALDSIQGWRTPTEIHYTYFDASSCIMCTDERKLELKTLVCLISCRPGFVLFFSFLVLSIKFIFWALVSIFLYTIYFINIYGMLCLMQLLVRHLISIHWCQTLVKLSFSIQNMQSVKLYTCMHAQMQVEGHPWWRLIIVTRFGSMNNKSKLHQFL